MEPIVITGASGFLGSSFLVQLLRQSQVARVYLLARRPLGPSDRYLQKLFNSLEEGERLWAKVRILEGDLSDSVKLSKALAELALRETQKFRVFHLAAQISEKADPAFIRRLNVDATKIITEWANAHASRMTFISSVAAFGTSRQPLVRTEADFEKYDVAFSHSIYFESKRQAHLALIKSSKIGYDIYCPSVIHGRFDNLKDTRSRLDPYLKKGLSWAPPGGANFVPLQRVLEKLNESLAKDANAPASVELVVGANWTFKNYIEIFLKSRGIQRSLKLLPQGFFRLIETFSAILPASLSSLLVASRFLYFRSQNEKLSESELEKMTLQAIQESADSR